MQVGQLIGGAATEMLFCTNALQQWQVSVISLENVWDRACQSSITNVWKLIYVDAYLHFYAYMLLNTNKSLSEYYQSIFTETKL